MNLYRTLDATYHALAARSVRAAWQTEFDNLDALVGTIRNDRPDSDQSDAALRRLIEIGRTEPDAMAVALYALAPALRRRLGRAATHEYRTDALADLAFVLLDSPLDRPRLAHRLVNRAHNRVYKAAGRAHQRGVVHPVTITPHDPELFTRHTAVGPDIAGAVADRLDLVRFKAAVHDAIDAGQLAETAWSAYRDHRLRRAVDPTSPACNGVQRKLASRAATRLQHLIETHLHAA